MVRLVERETRTAGLAADRGLVVIPPFDHPDIIAGQGTVGLEIVEDLPAVDTVLAPVGGGGLISGVAIAVKAISPRTRVVAVEPELAGDLARDSGAASESSGIRAYRPHRRRRRPIACGGRADLATHDTAGRRRGYGVRAKHPRRHGRPGQVEPAGR